MFDCEYLEQHVYPVALTLAEDKVSEVRATATLVVSHMIRTHLCGESHDLTMG